MHLEFPVDIVVCVANYYAHVVWRKNFTAAGKPILVEFGLDGITQEEPTTMLTRGIEAPVCEFV
jgi:hypothetical protein